jgi:hypothetical protein
VINYAQWHSKEFSTLVLSVLLEISANHRRDRRATQSYATGE